MIAFIQKHARRMVLWGTELDLRTPPHGPRRAALNFASTFICCAVGAPLTAGLLIRHLLSPEREISHRSALAETISESIHVATGILGLVSIVVILTIAAMSWTLSLLGLPLISTFFVIYLGICYVAGLAAVLIK